MKLTIYCKLKLTINFQDNLSLALVYDKMCIALAQEIALCSPLRRSNLRDVSNKQCWQNQSTYNSHSKHVLGHTLSSSFLNCSHILPKHGVKLLEYRFLQKVIQRSSSTRTLGAWVLSRLALFRILPEIFLFFLFWLVLTSKPSWNLWDCVWRERLGNYLDYTHTHTSQRVAWLTRQ